MFLRNKRRVYILGALLFVLVIYLFALFSLDEATTQYNDGYVHIKEDTWRIKVAETLPQRVQGLSGIQELPLGAGLLFVFPTDDIHGIWMKDMNFPIDIVWINSEYVVVHIERNVSPDTYPRVFRPSEHARYVLEINGGNGEKIKIGDEVIFDID